MNGLIGWFQSPRPVRQQQSCPEEVELARDFVHQYVGRRMPPELTPTLSVSDVVQSVMVLVVRNGHTFRGETDDELKGWLARISERKMIDLVRRHRPRQCPEKVREQFTPPQDCLDIRCPSQWLGITEQHMHLMSCVERLPAKIREIVIRRYRDELTFDRISEHLQIPTTTCRRRWVKGLSMLSKMMREQPVDGSV